MPGAGFAFRTDASVVARAALLSIPLGLLAGAQPAWSAVRMTISDALRYSRMSARWSRALAAAALRVAQRAGAHRGATAVTLFGVAISVMVYVVMGATADSLAGVAASTGDPRT